MIHIYKSINVTHSNRMKDKNRTTISTDTENASDKTEHPITRKPLNTSGMEGMSFNIIQPQLTPFSRVRKTKHSSTETQKQDRMPPGHFYLT